MPACVCVSGWTAGIIHPQILHALALGKAIKHFHVNHIVVFFTSFVTGAARMGHARHGAEIKHILESGA